MNSWRKATREDFEPLCDLFRIAAEEMERRGLRQWHWGDYPNADVLQEDIARERMYVCCDGGALLSAIVAQPEDEPAYAAVPWLFGIKPGVLHRLAVRPQARGAGLGRASLVHGMAMLREKGCDSVRMDTCVDNLAAQQIFASLNLRFAGDFLLFDNRPDMHFLAHEAPLTPDCPLLPIRMHPAFRGGKLTPWGGDKLQTLYGKPIAEIPTGESLEISCIPGLESRDDTGVTLPDLIARYGVKLVGDYAGKAFPLLLKLIDAKEALSVQVHPNDAYANAHEGGKLGKTEAWLILDAPEGAELVYGIRPGTSAETLREACLHGAAVSPLLRRVRVKAGDVCFIPAGCVHAIGAGIVLYEIQQSSDITYRFYDWDRVDAKGNKRALHIDQAMAVTDLGFALDPLPAKDAPICRVLENPIFSLDLMQAGSQPVDLPEIRDFGFLTALDGDLLLTWNGGRQTVRKGESFFLPHAAPALRVTGSGRAALSMPAALR